MRYLLSTGESTTDRSRYISDLFRLHMEVYPREIPGLPNLGFDFLLTDVTKDRVLDEIKSRVANLVSKFQQKFTDIKMTVDSITLISESKARIVVTINNYSEEYEVDTRIY